MGLLGDAGDPVEEVAVELRIRASRLREDLNQHINTARKMLSEMGKDTKESEKGFIDLGQAVSMALGNLGAKAATMLLAGLQKILAIIPSIVSSFVAGGLQMNASLQSLMVSLTSMLGDQETALALINRMREQAAALGQDPTGLVMAARSFLPYAEGNVDALQDMLVLAQQLAVLDPFSGFQGANRAIREAMSGNVKTLEAIFELPRQKLQELRNEWQKTGDTSAFVKGLQELVGQFGVTEDSIKAMAETVTGKMNIIKSQFTEVQRIATAPLFAAMQKHLNIFADAFGNRFNDMKSAALVTGAVMAASFDMAAEALGNLVKGTSEGVKGWQMAIQSIPVIIEAFTKIAENALVNFSTNVVVAFYNAVNSVIDIYNKVAGFLRLPELEKKQPDIEKISESFRKGYSKALAGGKDAVLDLFPNLSTMQTALTAADPFFDKFGERVQDYIDEFQYLLENDQSALEKLGKDHEDAHEEDVGQWTKYLQQIRDILEDHNEALIAEQERHADKMAEIAADAAEAEAEARTKYADELEEVNTDYADDAAEINQERAERIEDIEEQHQERLREIIDRSQEDLFDAVNARDARRVYEILMNARKEREEANEEKEKQLADAEEQAQKDLENLERNRQKRIKELQEALDKELQQIAKNQQEQRNAELRAYQQRLMELQNSLNEKLYMLGRSWAEETEMTAEGVGTVMALASAVFGYNGSYLSMYDGFNSALTAKVIETNTILGQIQYPEPIDVTTSGGTSGGGGGGGGGISGGSGGVGGGSIINMTATGFDATVRKPTLFMAAERGRPERVTVIPETSKDYYRDKMDGGGDGWTKVLLRASGVSQEFEAMMVESLSKVVGGAVRGRRRGRS